MFGGCCLFCTLFGRFATLLLDLVVRPSGFLEERVKGEDAIGYNGIVLHISAKSNEDGNPGSERCKTILVFDIG